MKNTERKESVTVKELAEAIRAAVREEIVGWTEPCENGFFFLLPGGKKFRVSVEEA